MQAESSVEWDLVDYGSGVFHVASYQTGPPAKAAALEPTAPALEPAEAENARIPECFFLRCWGALRDGCGAV